jgi:outer membrane autotransporter protein
MSVKQTHSSQQARASRGRYFKPSVLALALSSALALPGAAMAADWIGTTQDWTDPTNWSTGVVPTAADDVILNVANPAMIQAYAASVQNATIGDTGKGVLLLNGGSLDSVIGVVGAIAGSVGEVTLNGTDAAWANTATLTVGDGGTGTLTILEGNTVSNTNGFVGNAVGAVGTVVVDGKVGNVSSTWTNSGNLIVGNAGTGTLKIINGGAVFSSNTDIGSMAGSTGAVTVDGPGSIWTDSITVSVGQAGTGSLAITNGGVVKSDSGVVGGAPGSTGTVKVDGKDSAWNNDADLVVGYSGKGTLVISNGGSVKDANALIGYFSGSVGQATVTGANSTWTSTGILYVGGVGAGTLAISAGAQVKDAAGIIGGDTGSSGAVTVDGASWTHDVEFAVGYSGAGSLVVSNGGTVKDQRGFIGYNPTATGHVTVDGQGSSWTHDLDLSIGVDGTAELAISRGGMVSAPAVLIAGTASSTGTLNIGSAPGSAPVAPGTLTTGMVLFGDGDGSLNFNHTSTNYAFDAPMSGAATGKIVQFAGNTNLTADSSGFFGQTLVNGGRLSVNGSLANSATTVNNKGTLGGGGTVGNLLANAGGTVAPGNSIGTLSVNGNVTQQAGSIYAVEVSAANADLIDATGTATIQSGAILKAIKFGAAPLLLGKKYMVLQANGGVAGKYSLVGNSAFLAFADTYDANHAYLTVTKSKTFVDVAMTPNQKAAASGVEGLGAGNMIYDAISVLQTDGEAQAAFDQVSGEIHPTVRAVQIEDSRFVRDAALDRLRSFDGQAASLTVMPKAEDGKAADLPSTRDLAYWGRAMGGWGRINGDGNAATVKRDTAGFLLGVDRMVNDDWRLGILSGYSRSSMDVNERNSSATSDNYHLGLYGGRRWGDLVLRSGAAYTAHSISTSRTPVFAGFSDNLKADYTAETMQAFGELGWRIKSGNTEFEPFAGLAHVNVSSDGFIERGGPAALTGRVAHSGVTFSTLGLRATSDFSLSGGTSVTARGSLGWRHAFGDTLADTGLSFGNGAPFVVYGVPIAKSAAVVEAGLDFKLSPLTTLGVSYGGQFGSGLRDQSARVNFKVSF